MATGYSLNSTKPTNLTSIVMMEMKKSGVKTTNLPMNTTNRTNLMLLNEISQLKLSMEKERRCQREEIKQSGSEILFLDDTNCQLQQVIEKQAFDFKQLQQQVAFLSTQLQCLREDFAEREEIKQLRSEILFLDDTNCQLQQATAKQSLDFKQLQQQVAFLSTQLQCLGEDFAEELNSGDETNHVDYDESSLKDLNRSLTPYNAMIKSKVKEEEYLSHTPLQIDGTLAYDDEESPYSLDVSVVDAANPGSQDASSPKIKSQEFGEMGYSSLTKSGSQDDSSLEYFNHFLTPYNAMIKSQVKAENYSSHTPLQIQDSCSRTLAYDDEVSTNSLELKGMGKSEVEVLRSEMDLLNTNKEQETEISQLKLLLEVKSNEVEKQKELCLHRWGEINDLRSVQLIQAATNSEFHQLVEKQGAQLKQATQVIPTLQRHVSYLTCQNSQLQQLREKQDSELKQAKQVIPTLERLVNSLKGENSQLQQFIEKQDLELKHANQVIPTLERLVTSLTDQIHCLGESLQIEDFNSRDSTTPSGPNDIFDPFCAKIQSQAQAAKCPSCTLTTGPQESANSMEVCVGDAMDSILTPYRAMLNSQEFKKMGCDTFGDQQVEDKNLSVLEIPTGYSSDVCIIILLRFITFS